MENDTAKTYESVGELVKFLIGIFDSSKSRSQRAYGKFNLNSNGAEIMRLGRNIPHRVENLCAEVISRFPDSPATKKNYR